MSKFVYFLKKYQDLYMDSSLYVYFLINYSILYLVEFKEMKSIIANIDMDNINFFIG